MDLWATKDHYEVETEESERLVRPAPKLKTPRHDLRRERMDTDSDPDIDTDPDIARDKDLSLNYKNVGGSTAVRVLSRFLGYDPLALKVAGRFFEADLDKADLNAVVRKEDGKHVNVTDKTLKEHGGDYEEVEDEEEGDGKKEKPVLKGKGPSPEDARQMKELAKDPKIRGVLDIFDNPKARDYTVFTTNPSLPAATFLPGVKLPPGVKTLGDLQAVHQLLKNPPAAGKPSGAKGKKKKDPYAGFGEDEAKEVEEFTSQGGHKSPEFKSWAEGQTTVGHADDGTALFKNGDGERVPFETLSSPEQHAIKEKFDVYSQALDRVNKTRELGESDPQVGKVLKELGDPESELSKRLDKFKRELDYGKDLSEYDVQKALPELKGVKLPPELQNLQHLSDAAVKAYSPAAEDESKELKEWVSAGGHKGEDFGAWADKQKDIVSENGKLLFTQGKKKVPFEKLPPDAQAKFKARFDANAKLEGNAESLKKLTEDPKTKALLRDLGDSRSELRQRIDTEARAEGRDLEDSDIKKTIPELAHLNLPNGMTSTKDLLDAAEKVFAPIPDPKRDKANKQETLRAEAAIHESLPEDLAKHVESMGLHPEDVSHLLSGYRAAMTTPLSGNDLTEVTKGLMKMGGYTLDPESIEPPTKVWANGKELKFEELPPAEQAESFAQYKMHVLASSMAARERVTQSLTKSGLPEGPASVISEAMLKSGSNELTDETVQDFFRNSLKTSFVQRPISDAAVKKLVASVEHSPAARKLLSAYIQASNYADVQNRYMSNDPEHGKTRITEWDSPQSAAKKMEEASEYLRKKSELLPLDTRVVDPAMHFRNRIMDRMSTLAPEKVPALRGYLSDYENETHQAKVEQTAKLEKEFDTALEKEKHLAKQEREGPDQGAYRTPGNQDVEPSEEDIKERLRKKGITPPSKPIPPPGYEHWKDRKKTEESSKSAFDWLKSLFGGGKKKQASLTVEQRVLLRAAIPSLRQRVAFCHELGLKSPSYSSYSGCWTMGQSSTTVHTAVYWGQQPYEQTAPYPGWEQAQARDFSDQDFNSILTAAREWLKLPVLGRPIKGLYPDTQFRAALDLALRDHEGGKYSAGVYPTIYNKLLANLSDRPGPYELLTGKPDDVPVAGVKSAGFSDPVKSTYAATTERGTIMKASAQVRSFAARTAQTTSDPELAFDMLSLADKLAAEEQGQGQQAPAEQAEAQKQAAIKIAAQQVNKFNAVRSLVIRAAAQNPSLREVFLPILQAVK